MSSSCNKRPETRIIPRTGAACQTPEWQRELAGAFYSISDLCEHLHITPEQLPISESAAKEFPLKATRHYVGQIRPGDPTDPLLLQILPTVQELDQPPGFVDDPVGDLDHNPIQGIIHKYHGRALIIATGACAIHCRYCFRRHFPYSDTGNSEARWPGVIEYLSDHKEISEVILSGGDPLTLSDARLGKIYDDLATLPQLRRLRIHTRMPSVLPSRVTTELIDIIGNYPIKTVIVLHINHPRELTRESAQACRLLNGAGASLLNQSVFLKRINDDISTLIELQTSLFEQGIIPYYLHQLDRVTGASHYEVETKRALELHAAMRHRLPGYLLPRLVTECSGSPHKLELVTNRYQFIKS